MVPGGPVLALLPLPAADLDDLVAPHGEAERICGLEAGALCREVEAASRHVLVLFH